MTTKDAVVYIVDDDASVRLALSSLMRSVGFHVESYSTAREFLDSKLLNVPSCLILDVRLPGLLEPQSAFCRSVVSIGTS